MVKSPCQIAKQFAGDLENSIYIAILSESTQIEVFSDGAVAKWKRWGLQNLDCAGSIPACTSELVFCA